MKGDVASPGPMCWATGCSLRNSCFRLAMLARSLSHSDLEVGTAGGSMEKEDESEMLFWISTSPASMKCSFFSYCYPSSSSYVRFIASFLHFSWEEFHSRLLIWFSTVFVGSQFWKTISRERTIRFRSVKRSLFFSSGAIFSTGWKIQSCPPLNSSYIT